EHRVRGERRDFLVRASFGDAVWGGDRSSVGQRLRAWAGGGFDAPAAGATGV
ncbi:MAG: hypothetical protein AVDCRST_MAG25-3483, partial [uncultured Rubrobacteraceae bacterium]